MRNCTGRGWIAVLLTCAPVFWGGAAGAAPLSTAALTGEPIGEHVRFLHEQGERLDVAQAARAYAQGKFTPAHKPVLTFGIGAAPVWLALDVANPGTSAVVRRFAVETSWIDRIDLYFLRDGRVQAGVHAGDTQPFGTRPVASPFFWFDHAFAPATTTVLLRVETPDPMVLPIYLTSVDDTHARARRQEASYGLLYGFLGALLAYNFILFLSLRGRRYLFYSIYLLCFMFMNFTYTGHSYQWLWPESTRWQQWSNPVLMMVYSISGLLFAVTFLETRRLLPRLHRIVLGGIVVFVALQAGAALLGSQLAALLIAFVFVFLFAGTMVLLGARAWLAAFRPARYFLYASVSAAIGAAVTDAAVWGLIPFTAWTYRAVDMGMAIDATLLALALANQFRIGQEQRLRAEQLALIDPLTGINNRRAFTELVAPIWNIERRHQRDMSVLLLDIDRFKAINDAHGHAVGDRVLVQVAEFLRAGMRDGDVVARWGGEEFIVFLPETTLAEARSIAERLHTGISALRFAGAATHFSCTATFGVAHNDDPDASLDGLISMADRHLYRGKELGRDRVCSG